MSSAGSPADCMAASDTYPDPRRSAAKAQRAYLRESRSAARNEAGVVLLVVLWVVTLLTIIAGSYSVTLRTDTSIVHNAVLAAQARAAAHAGVRLAVLGLVNRITPDDSTASSIRFDTVFSTARVHIIVTDESGKINLNRASPALLNNLLRAAGVESTQADALVGAIEDWRDQDDLRSLNGAEKGDYQAAGMRYVPRNAPFQSVDELALVLGMKFALFKQLQGALTVYSSSGGGNPSSAPDLVRLALGGADGERGEFRSIDHSMEADTQPARPLEPGGGLKIGAAGQILSIHVQAQFPEGIQERLTALVRLSPNRVGAPFSVIAWKEDDEGTFD